MKLEKLEAGKEMDRKCVFDWLNEVYITPGRAFNEYTDDEIKVFAHDALVLLKEQERKNEKYNALQYELIQLKTKLKEQEEQYNNLAEWAEGHIVFCKDCRLSKIEKVFKHVPESKETVRWCELIKRCVDDEWFCADGRRRH